MSYCLFDVNKNILKAACALTMGESALPVDELSCLLHNYGYMYEKHVLFFCEKYC